MTQTLDDALKQTKLASDGRAYAMIRLPTHAAMAAASIVIEAREPFCALLVDEDEVTLVIAEDLWARFAPRAPGAVMSETRYRLITFDIALEPTLTGYMARVSAILAAIGVPLFPFAAYTRDHIFVPLDQYDAALAALQAGMTGSDE